MATTRSDQGAAATLLAMPPRVVVGTVNIRRETAPSAPSTNAVRYPVSFESARARAVAHRYRPFGDSDTSADQYALLFIANG